MIDASLEVGRTAGLPLDFAFCGRLADVAHCAKLLQESEQDFRDMGQTSSVRSAVQNAQATLAAAREAGDTGLVDDASAELARARKRLGETNDARRDVKRTLDIRRRNQRTREDIFLREMAHPLLVGEGYLIAEQSPTLPPTPSSLRRMSKEDEVGDSAEAGVSAEQEEAAPLVAEWEKGRRELAACEQQYDRIVSGHARTLADHLVIYGNATLQTAEQQYEAKVGAAFPDREREAWSYVEEAGEEYERARAEARRAGVEDLPLSPTDFADWTQDGRDGSATSAWFDALKASAPDRQKRVLRWSRRVVKGYAQRTPEASPSWSVDSVEVGRAVDHEVTGMPSEHDLIERYSQKSDKIRPVAEGLRNDMWAGRLRDTGARRAGSSEGGSSILWAQTHPAQTERDLLKERRAQKEAVRTG